MAKGTRRELRRAFGPEVLDTVERQGLTLEHIAKLLHVLRADVSELARDHALLKKDTTRYVSGPQVIDAIDDSTAIYREFMTRPFLSRLRWLVTGR